RLPETSYSRTGFLDIEDVIGDGDVALTLEFDPDTNYLFASSYALPITDSLSLQAENTTKSSMIPDDVTSILSCSTNPLAGSSLSESIPYPRLPSKNPSSKIPLSKFPGAETTHKFTKASLAYLYLHAGSTPKITIPLPEITTSYSTYTAETQPKIKGVQVKKKYKPVALRTKPVAASIPDKFQIERNIIGDPLRDMPILSVNPPPYIPTGQFSRERKDQFVKTHDNGFLLKSKIDLFVHLMCLQNGGFAWDDSEQGNF
ncbi:hypothetical protein C0991_009966, partial [Blastosporella zonata]